MVLTHQDPFALRQTIRLIHCLQKERGASCTTAAALSTFYMKQRINNDNNEASSDTTTNTNGDKPSQATTTTHHAHFVLPSKKTNLGELPPGLDEDVIMIINIMICARQKTDFILDEIESSQLQLQQLQRSQAQAQAPQNSNNITTITQHRESLRRIRSMIMLQKKHSPTSSISERGNFRRIFSAYNALIVNEIHERIVVANSLAMQQRTLGGPSGSGGPRSAFHPANAKNGGTMITGSNNFNNHNNNLHGYGLGSSGNTNNNQEIIMTGSRVRAASASDHHPSSTPFTNTLVGKPNTLQHRGVSAQLAGTSHNNHLYQQTHQTYNSNSNNLQNNQNIHNNCNAVNSEDKIGVLTSSARPSTFRKNHKVSQSAAGDFYDNLFQEVNLNTASDNHGVFQPISPVKKSSLSSTVQSQGQPTLTVNVPVSIGTSHGLPPSPVKKPSQQAQAQQTQTTQTHTQGQVQASNKPPRPATPSQNRAVATSEEDKERERHLHQQEEKKQKEFIKNQNRAVSLLSLLLSFVQLKESTCIERAFLTSLLTMSREEMTAANITTVNPDPAIAQDPTQMYPSDIEVNRAAKNDSPIVNKNETRQASPDQHAQPREGLSEVRYVNSSPNATPTSSKFIGNRRRSLSVGTEMLFNDLVMEMENQHHMVRKLRKKAQKVEEEDKKQGHQWSLSALVDESVVKISPELQNLHNLIRQNFDLNAFTSSITIERFWNMITLYTDRLHSLELLILEEIESCGVSSPPPTHPAYHQYQSQSNIILPSKSPSSAPSNQQQVVNSFLSTNNNPSPMNHQMVMTSTTTIILDNNNNNNELPTEPEVVGIVAPPPNLPVSNPKTSPCPSIVHDSSRSLSTSGSQTGNNSASASNTIPIFDRSLIFAALSEDNDSNTTDIAPEDARNVLKSLTPHQLKQCILSMFGAHHSDSCNNHSSQGARKGKHHRKPPKASKTRAHNNKNVPAEGDRYHHHHHHPKSNVSGGNAGNYYSDHHYNHHSTNQSPDDDIFSLSDDGSLFEDVVTNNSSIPSDHDVPAEIEIKENMIENPNNSSVNNNNNNNKAPQSYHYHHQHSGYQQYPLQHQQQQHQAQQTVQEERAKEWEIDLYQVQFIRSIGRGSAGTTYLGKWQEQPVAIKVAAMTEMGVEGWGTEVRSLQTLHHPNIIRLYGAILNNHPLTRCLVLEYCDRGDLSQALKSKNLPKNFVDKTAFGMASGMSYLHSRNILHRDIKPGNILIHGNLVGGDYIVKLTDFGLATMTQVSYF